jgi:hypothetical protein
MITVHLMGGLGNQLFMIFTTIAYSIENKVKFVIPKIKPDKTSGDGSLRPTYWDNFLQRLKPFLVNMPNGFKLYKEQHHHYIKIPNQIKNMNFKLYGYFQSYKYFENSKETIFKMIGIQNIKDTIKEKYKKYFDIDGEIVSLHFRIGDYKILPDYHSILDIDYYKEAIIDILEKNNNIKHILCFGEDDDYLILYHNIEILQLAFPQLVFKLCADGIQDWEQMVLMSCCDHNIIANSSFSWWGAYFNENPEKIVYYPSKWFGPKLEHQKTLDMFPPSWKKIIN